MFSLFFRLRFLPIPFPELLFLFPECPVGLLLSSSFGSLLDLILGFGGSFLSLATSALRASISTVGFDLFPVVAP